MAAASTKVYTTYNFSYH